MTGPEIRCDGCTAITDSGALSLVTANTVQVRYCAPCLDDWQALDAVCKAQAAVYQRLQDLFEQQARQQSPLRVTPLDFPKFWQAQEPPRELVLG